MNIAEEGYIFKHEVGRAIGQWVYAEGQLLRIVQYCTLKQGQSVAAAYLAIEHFRSQLDFCDTLILAIHGTKPWISYWETVRRKASNLSGLRNKLAHGWQAQYVHEKSGKRYAIVPSLQSNGVLVHKDGASAPRGSLFLRDVVAARLEFQALTSQLCNVYALVCSKPKIFPEASAQSSRPPSVRTIEAQMRAALGRKPRPSRA